MELNHAIQTPAVGSRCGLPAFATLASSWFGITQAQIILPCTIQFPQLLTVSSAGGSGIISLTQTNACGSLTVSPNADWASARILTPGSTNTVEWTVQPNRGSAKRYASITFQGNGNFSQLLIEQQGSCAATLTDYQALIPYTGATSSLIATPASASCPWTAGSIAKWT